MRKLLLGFAVPDGILSPRPSLISLPSSPSPSPSPSHDYKPDPSRHHTFIFHSLPFVDSGFDLAAFIVVGILLLLSLLSFFLVLHLRVRSRRWCHLQHFNYLWAVRLLLVTLASLWAVNEILRLPSLRQDYLYPSNPILTLTQQADLCKVHVVLSLGLFEPGFLVTLLFLVNVSIKKRLPRRLRALATSVFVSCSPVLLLQGIFVFYEPFEEQLPKLLHGSSVLQTDMYGKRSVLCTYPFFSCVIFSAFAIVYSLAFFLSFWRLVALVINRGIRARINFLVSTLMVTLPIQILGMALSFLWSPEDAVYCFVVLGVFLSVSWLITVGLVILVVKPIMEALAAGLVCRSTGDQRPVVEMIIREEDYRS